MGLFRQCFQVEVKILTQKQLPRLPPFTGGYEICNTNFTSICIFSDNLPQPQNTGSDYETPTKIPDSETLENDFVKKDKNNFGSKSDQKGNKPSQSKKSDSINDRYSSPARSLRLQDTGELLSSRSIPSSSSFSSSLDSNQEPVGKGKRQTKDYKTDKQNQGKNLRLILKTTAHS